MRSRPFLQFSLAYGANGTRIDVARGASLATAANTPNQRAVAARRRPAADRQGLPKPLTQLFPQQVGGVLDGLSGELHPATAIALVEGSRYVRDAALSRRAGASAPGSDVGDATGAWVQAIGGQQQLDGDFNTARTEANSNGLLVGIDREVLRLAGWRAGRYRPFRRQAAGPPRQVEDRQHALRCLRQPHLGRLRPARWLWRGASTR